MSETQTTEQQITTVVESSAINPFSETSWTETTAVEQPTGTVEAPKETSQAPVQEETKQDKDTILEANEWLKKEFGWDTTETAKTEIAELRKLKDDAKTPAQIQFANEQSQKFFEALREGKEDDVYTYLDQKKRLDRLEKMELKGVAEAAEIIKANLQFKHKDLTLDEITFLYNKRYSTPPKPKQAQDQDDADYAVELEGWNNTVKEKELEMIIEAKLAKPDLLKYKSELVLPDIPKKESDVKPTEVDQKSLEQLQALRNGFLQKIG